MNVITVYYDYDPMKTKPANNHSPAFFKLINIRWIP